MPVMTNSNANNSEESSGFLNVNATVGKNSVGGVKTSCFLRAMPVDVRKSFAFPSPTK